MENNSSITIAAISISTTIAYSALVYNQAISGSNPSSIFRIAQVDTSTGISTKELNGDVLIGIAGNSISAIYIQQDQTNDDLYLSAKLNTGVFGYSGNELVYMKLNQMMSVIWMKRLHGISTNPSYDIVSTCLGINNYWQLVNFYTDSSTQKFGIQKISKTDGTITSEQTFSNSQPSNIQGQIKLNNNETTWYTALYYSASYFQSLQTGQTLTNQMSKNFQLSQTFFYVSLQVQSQNGNFLIMALSTTYQIIFIEVSHSSGQVVKSFALTRGSSSYSAIKLLSSNRNGQLIIAAQAPNLLPSAAKSRILIYSTFDDLSITKTSCVNTSQISIPDFTSASTAVSSTSATPVYSPIAANGASFFSLQIEISLVKQQHLTSQDLYPMRDSSASIFCELPLYTNINLMTYDFNILANTTMSTDPVKIQDCTGNQYQALAVQQADGTTSSDVTLDSTTGRVSLTFNSINSLKYSGDYSFRLKTRVLNTDKYVYFKTRFSPLTSLVRDPTLPNHDITSCEESIYPFMVGFDSTVNLNWFDIDPFGNLLSAGSGIKVPYGTQDGIPKGFVSLTDQRGSNYWVTQINLLNDQTRASSCQYAKYSSSAVYAGCSVSSELFLSTLTFIHILKINHQSGNIIFLKKVPNDNVNPSSQRVLAIENIGLDQVFTIYTSFRSTKWNAIGVKYEEISDTVQDIRFFNYLNMTQSNYFVESLIDQSSNSFWIVRHQMTNKLVVMRGQMSDFSMTTFVSLSDMATADCVQCQSALYDTNQLLVATTSQSNGNYMILYSLDKISLAIINSIKILFPSSYQLNTISLSTDDARNIYITMSRVSLFFAKLDVAFTLVYQRVWTGPGSASFSSRVIGSKFFKCDPLVTSCCSSSEVYTGFSANLQFSTYMSQGMFVFRGTKQDDCFDFPDIQPSNISWYASFNILTSAASPTTISDMAEDYPFNNDNYPLVYETNAYSTKNYGFSSISADRYKWGDIELPSFYKRYPLSQFKCGMIARQKKYQTYNGQGTILEFQNTSVANSRQTIIINSTFQNCQGRPFSSVIWNGNSDNQLFNDEVTKAFLFNSTTMMTLILTNQKYFFQQPFRVRYFDSTQGTNMYYYDHSLLVRYVADKNLSDFNYNNKGDNCPGNPFPMALGQDIGLWNYAIYLAQIAAHPSEASFVLVGQAGRFISYMDYFAAQDDDYDAFVTLLSQTGNVQWYNKLNYQLRQKEEANGVTIAGDNVYVSIWLPENTYLLNIVVLIKLTYNEGKTVWQKKMIPRNLIDQNDFMMLGFQEMRPHPNDSRYIMTSLLYYWKSASGVVAGNVMIYDNGTDLSSLYEFQYKAKAAPASQSNSGQVLFDDETDHIYLSSCALISNTVNKDIFVQKVQTYTGIQEWNLLIPTTSAINNLIVQPAITINPKTRKIYVAAQQATYSIHIACITKQGVVLLRQHLRLSSQPYLNIDLASDPRNGNIIVAGTYNGAAVITFLNENLGFLGAYQLHEAQNNCTYGRMLAQFDNYVYFAYRGRRLNNGLDGGQAIVQKKSLDLYDRTRFECHDYNPENTFSLFTNFSTTSINAPADVVFFTNESIAFLSDYSLRNRNLNHFFTRIQVSEDSYLSGYLFQTSITCAAYTGKQGAWKIYPYPLEVVLGTRKEFLFDESSLEMQNCQGNQILISQIADERQSATGTATNQQYLFLARTNVTVDTTNPLNTVYPGTRWLHMSVSVNGQASVAMLPLHILPVPNKSATLVQPDPMCPDNDQQYPKVIGTGLTNQDTNFGGADIDQINGNIVMCGGTQEDSLITKQYTIANWNMWITLFDQNGNIQWAMTGNSIWAMNQNTGYLSCVFGANQASIFGLFFNANSNNEQLFTKHDYTTGKVAYVAINHGTYPPSWNNYIMVIDQPLNHLYFTGLRNDQGGNYQDFVYKIDSSTERPMGRYSSYCTQTGVGSPQGVYSLFVFQDGQDYLLSSFRNSYNSQYWAAISLRKKTTGELIKSRMFSHSNTAETFFDVISDGQFVYYGIGTKTPKQIQIVKMDLPNLNVIAANGHFQSYGQSFTIVHLANDTDFVYAHSFEYAYGLNYLTKFKKTDLSIIQAVYYLENGNTQMYQSQLIIFDGMLYLFSGNRGYNSGFSGSKQAIVNQFTTTFQTPQSCIEPINLILNGTISTITTQVPVNLAYFVYYFDYYFNQRVQMYYEYWSDPKIQRLYDPKVLNCFGQAPKFYDELEDQIITLPDTTTYTFNWPSDCFNSELSFSWSVDMFTNANKPSFITFQNTSSTVTMFLNPTTSDVGTYVVRVRFDVVSKQNVFTERTIVVEVYPEQSYLKESMFCPTSNYPAIFQSSNTQTVWYIADLDPTGYHFAICGQTINPLLDKTPSLQSGFISGFTLGMSLEFHITIDFKLAGYFCNLQYDPEGYIVSAFSFAVTLTDSSDSLAFFKHTGNGKYVKGRQFSRPGYLMNLRHHQVDQSNGHSYITGTHKNNYFVRGYELEGYILKLDKDFNYLFFRTFEWQYSDFQSQNFDFSSTGVYLIFQFLYPSTNYQFSGLLRISSTDGGPLWSKGLYNPSNLGQSYLNIQSKGTVFQSSQRVLITQNYLYAATVYYTSLSPLGSKMYLLQINPTDGSLLSRVEWNEQFVSYLALLQSPSNPSSLIVQWSLESNIRIALFNIGSPPLSYKDKVLTLRYTSASSSQFYRTNLFEKNGTVWSFGRFLYQTISGAVLSKFKDFSNFEWDQPCTLQLTESSFLSSRGAPVGSNDYVSLNWQNLPSLAQLNTWLAPTKLYNRWSGNIEYVVMYPINNISANPRSNFAGHNCNQSSIPSAIPIASRLGASINSTAGGISVMPLTQSIQLPKMQMCSDDPLVYTLTYSNKSSLSLSTLFSFDPTLRTLIIRAVSNSFVGIYSLTYSGNSSATVSASTSFQIQINRNQAPVPVLNFMTPVTMYSFHNYSWKIELDYDFEDDQATFELVVLNYNNATVSSPWVQINQSDDTGIQFSVIQAPQTTNILTTQQYYLQVVVKDSYNTATPNLYNISLLIIPNQGPKLDPSVSLIIPDIRIPSFLNFTLWKNNFTDLENDSFSVICQNTSTTALNMLWIGIISSNTPPEKLQIQGQTPRDNSYNGTYLFTCVAKDQWNNSQSYQFSLNVLPKQKIVINHTQTNVSILLPETTSFDFSNVSFDPQGEPNYYSLYVNETLYSLLSVQSWLKWNNYSALIDAIPTDNSQGGNHSLSIRLDDYISTPSYINFTLEVIQNWPLNPKYLKATLPNRYVTSNNFFLMNFDKNEIFENPEGKEFQMYFRLSQPGGGLPYFISKNYSNGTIGGYASDIDIGSFSIECVGVDDASWETVLKFSIIVQPCFFKCQQCWDSSYNTCKSCKKNFFFYYYECIDKCIVGFYPDTESQACKKCPQPCKECYGPDFLSQCTRCSDNYFFLDNGCYLKCPDGFYGDKTDYHCKKCNSACHLCFGPSTRQCYNCTEVFDKNELDENIKSGYLLSGTACIIPKCIVGQYFKWADGLLNGVATGKCEPCHSSCKKCVGPFENSCTQCYLGSMLLSTNHCQECDKILGYYTNEEQQCEDICGDGIIIDKECDDGNINSGDGCSEMCKIEYGFACPTANVSCQEIIPPTFKIVSLSQIDQAFISFSEPVLLTSTDSISQQNLDVKITGRQSQYIFDWRLVYEPKNPLLPNRQITRFSIILQSFQQSMDGTEQIQLSFKDSTQLKDLSGNSIPTNYFSQINANPYTFLSPEEKTTAEGGATSIKYSFISVFSFNLVLKLVLNSSMQFLWGLVHSLQVFSFLLYLNINFPENVIAFTEYFKVASGDIDEFNQYIPNIADYLVKEENVVQISDTQRLYQKFLEDDISPYFLMAYGQKITLWTFAFVVILPTILFLNKLCKKVKIWDDIKGSFFFNAPLRGFVEQYIEIVLQVLINSQFIKTKNYDQTMTTLFAFVFGVISLLLPFLAMTIIKNNRKNIEKAQWEAQYGMLTEGCNKQEISQLFYYPIFLFQRLFITGVIVFVYDLPFLQCSLIIFGNLIMIGYLIMSKPFSEENMQATSVLDEIVLSICIILFSNIYLQEGQISLDSKKNLGWLIIALIMFSVVKNFAIVIYFAVIQTRKGLQQMFEAEDSKIDSPFSSEEEEYDLIQNKDEFDTQELIEEVKLEQMQNVEENFVVIKGKKIMKIQVQFADSNN